MNTILLPDVNICSCSDIHVTLFGFIMHKASTVNLVAYSLQSDKLEEHPPSEDIHES